MSQANLINKEAVLLYLNGAREAIRSACFNLDNAFYGVAINRAYYAFFYTATALLLTLDLTRSKHSGVLAGFREHFVKSGLFPSDDSYAYGEAFESRNVIDYETLGKAEETEARVIVEKANGFVDRCEKYLSEKGYL